MTSGDTQLMRVKEERLYESQVDVNGLPYITR